MTDAPHLPDDLLELEALLASEPAAAGDALQSRVLGRVQRDLATQRRAAQSVRLFTAVLVVFGGFNVTWWLASQTDMSAEPPRSNVSVSAQVDTLREILPELSEQEALFRRLAIGSPVSWRAVKATGAADPVTAPQPTNP